MRTSHDPWAQYEKKLFFPNCSRTTFRKSQEARSPVEKWFSSDLTFSKKGVESTPSPSVVGLNVPKM